MCEPSTLNVCVCARVAWTWHEIRDYVQRGGARGVCGGVGVAEGWGWQRGGGGGVLGGKVGDQARAGANAFTST